MKPIAEWTEADLLELVAARTPESLQLDFKSCRAFADGGFATSLSKDVVSFANAIGGHIVFGILEDDKVAVGVEDGVPVGTMTAERLENLISGNISPQLGGIFAHKIALANGNETFVIWVPEADYSAPHQASDNRYYRRHMTRCLPMADHEVRDLMRRGSVPAPKISFGSAEMTLDENGRSLKAWLSITNDSPTPMSVATITFFLDATLRPRAGASEFGNSEMVPAVTVNGPAQLHRYRRNYSTPGSMPIFKEESFTLSEMELNPDGGGPFVLGWIIRFPGGTVEEWRTLVLRDSRLVLVEPS